MFQHLRSNVLLLVFSVLFCAVLYPLLVLAIGQGLFPTTANGSLVTGPDGNPVGSRLIAQEFKGDEWFQPRPSAVGYTANASGGSNLGANNPKLRERVEESLKLHRDKPAGSSDVVPADAVTTSGSGLDPHITLKNAEEQLERVVAAWATKPGGDAAQVRETLQAILKEAAFNPLMGLAGGELLVNVLEVNLTMSSRLQH